VGDAHRQRPGVGAAEALEVAIPPGVEARRRPSPPSPSPSRASSRDASCFSSRRRDSEGTSVRESRYEATIENTTDSASGVNRKRAGPSSITTGKNTMHTVRVAASAGTATWWAASRMATVSRFPMRRLRWMFSTSTVASSTSMPTASARPPRVIRFRVCPVRNSPTTPDRMATGMEVQTMTIERQLPRKNRIISETSPAAMPASRSTLLMAARTKTDWSKSRLSSIPCGAVALIVGSSSRTESTTARVEAPALRRIAR
jgi:hypothetical protein